MSQDQPVSSREKAVEERLETVLSRIKDGFYALDCHWRFTYANDRFCEMVGLSPAEILGQRIWSLFLEAAGTEVERQFQQALDEQTASQFEHFYAQGRRWYEYRVFPSADGLTIFTTDITERKQTELVLIEQKQLLERIAIEQPLDDCLAAVCAAIAQLTPHVRASFLLADVQRLTFPHCITPDFPSSFGQGLKDVPINDLCIGTCGEAVYRGQPVTCADIANDDRGSQDWRNLCLAHGVLACHSTPVLGADGLPLGALLLAFDEARSPTAWEYQLADFGVQVASLVLERDRAHAALHESEAKYRRLFESIDEGFCLVEVLFETDGTATDHRILQANAAFERHTGILDPNGKTASELVPGVEQHWHDLYAQVIQTGETVRLENRSDALDRWFDLLVWRVGDALTGQVAIVFTDITERKRAETWLQASHDTFRHLVETSPFGVYTVDADFRLAQVSAGAQKVFANIHPLIGRDFAEILRVLWPEPFASEVIARFRHTLETGEPYRSPSTIEYRHDINVVESYDWKLERLTLLDGRLGVVCHFYDLSERQHYEAALRESEERFRHMADNAPVMIWVTDHTGACTYLSQSWYDFTGQTEETGLGFGWLSRVHPDDFELAQQMFLNAHQRQEAFSLEYRLQAKHGAYIWAIDAASPWFGEDGQFKGYIGSVLDISERKRVEDERQQAEAALRESENRLRLALESTALGTWDFNPITGTLQWDDRCKAMFGLSSDTEINYDLFLAGLHPEDRERTDQVVQFALNPESNGEYEIEFRTVSIEDGVERWIAAKGKAFFNPAGIASRFIGTVLNRTEQKRAEAEREQLLQREQSAREEAERANRLKDEFLAVLSHELRSPLNPILGWSRLLQNGKLDESRRAEALKTIERNAKLQSQLIEDLLDISRIMQGKLSLTAAPVSLTFVITAAVETVRLAAEAKHIQLTLDLPTIAPLYGDAARLQQVVWNLLTNAVKFTPTGGQVTVELRQLEHVAQIRISDTGKGIQPQFLPHVFEYFRQEDGSTTRKFGGLGLGLAIVRQIVELHGGTVAAESQGENQGATFRVQLPVLSQVPLSLSKTANAPPAIGLPLDQIQILVVDDDDDTREFQAFLLEQNGARVIAVGSGAEALQLLDRWLPDLVVSDVGMAAMDGYMLMQQIRLRPSEQGGRIPAIALTAYAAEVDQQKAIQAGFQMHLTKPLEPERLIKEVLTLLDPNSGEKSVKAKHTVP